MKVMAEGNENYKDFITLKEAILLCDYTSDHLARLIRTGKVRGNRVGRSWLISRQDLERYLGGQEGNMGEWDNDALSLKEASAISQYTSDHLARLLRTGKISGVRRGHSWMVSRKALEEYLARTKKCYALLAATEIQSL